MKNRTKKLVDAAYKILPGRRYALNKDGTDDKSNMIVPTEEFENLRQVLTDLFDDFSWNGTSYVRKQR